MALFTADIPHGQQKLHHSSFYNDILQRSGSEMLNMKLLIPKFIILKGFTVSNREHEISNPNFHSSFVPPNIVKDNFQHENKIDDQDQKEHPWKPHDIRRKTLDASDSDPLDVSTLLQKLEDCEEKMKEIKAQKTKIPRFTWVPTMKIKSNIARNLAIFGKPFPQHKPVKVLRPKSIPVYRPDQEDDLGDENDFSRKILKPSWLGL